MADLARVGGEDKHKHTTEPCWLCVYYVVIVNTNSLFFTHFINRIISVVQK